MGGFPFNLRVAGDRRTARLTDVPRLADVQFSTVGQLDVCLRGSRQPTRFKGVGAAIPECIHCVACSPKDLPLNEEVNKK